MLAAPQRTRTRSGTHAAALLTAFVVALSCFALLTPEAARARQLQLPPPPKSGAEALASMPERRARVAEFMACGDELDFWRKVQNIKISAGDPTNHIIAKMLWLILAPDVPDEPSPVKLRLNDRQDKGHPLRVAQGGLIFAATGGTDEPPPVAPCTHSVVMSRDELAGLLGDRPPAGSDESQHEFARLLDQFVTVKTNLDNTMSGLEKFPVGDTDTVNDGLKRSAEFASQFGLAATTALNAAMARGDIPDEETNAGYGTVCANIIQGIKLMVDGPDMEGSPDAVAKLTDQQKADHLKAVLDKATFQITYQVTQDCMRRQINFALSKMHVHEMKWDKGEKKLKDITPQLGSSDLPCLRATFDPFDLSPVTLAFHISLSGTEGEWDQTLKELLRIAYLDREHKGKKLLNQDTIKHMQEELINLDGEPGLPSYGLFQCGDQEDSRGSSQDRNSEHSWLKDTLSSIGDLLSWLALRIKLILIVLAALALLGPIAAALGAIFGAGAVALGLMILFIRIPETENHKLMIETSRYLKNQIIIADLTQSGDDTSQYQKYQREVRDYLMDMFQTIMKEDFAEYNARPYARLSMSAVLNIAQFARDDPDLQASARMVLDFVSAKAAVQMNQGRRIVPFRRKMAVILRDSPEPKFDKLGRDSLHAVPYRPEPADVRRVAGPAQNPQPRVQRILG